MKESSRFLPFLPDFILFFPDFSSFFPIFPSFFLIFGKFFAVRGGTLPPWPPVATPLTGSKAVLAIEEFDFFFFFFLIFSILNCNLYY